MLLRSLRLKRTARARLLRERLTEPLHLNLISLFVAAFGSFRAKIAWDCVNRLQYAYGLLEAADQARRMGIKSITAMEFGVAAGEGLLNLCKLAPGVTRATGVEINLVGFDNGVGMPPALDYRDHPEEFQFQDFPMDHERLKRLLPPNCELVLGNVTQTVPEYRQKKLSSASPLGFAAIDVDYYSSTKEVLKMFLDADASKYIFLPVLYFDDIVLANYSDWTGELLAVNEFNAENQLRKIQSYRFLRSRRLFKNARWIDQIYLLHLFDHPWLKQHRATRMAPNVYLSIREYSPVLDREKKQANGQATVLNR